MKQKNGSATVVLLLALGLAVSDAAQAETLKEVFERAWRLAPDARVVEAKREEVAASRLVGDALLAGAPQLSLAQRSDRWNDRLGKREDEVGIALPLWMPGQRAARQRLAEAEGQENQRAIVVERLALAGALREALWALAMAKREVELAGLRLESTEQLERDIARRVKVGDLARSDLLLISQEKNMARAAVLEAKAQVVRAGQNYRVLTGGEGVPVDAEEALAAAPPPGMHPRLLASRAVADRSRADLGFAQESRREAPTLGMQWRRDRDTSGQPTRDSVGLAITIPFATQSRNAPAIARANTAVIEAESRAQRLQAELDAQELQAQAWLEAARSSVELAQEGAALAGERQVLLHKAFVLGEGSLAEALRAQSQGHAAKIAVARSQIRLAAAIASLNQARGVTP